MRILICDDDHHIIDKLRHYLEEYFNQNNYSTPEIAAYSDGESLLADPDAKDLVFLDVKMSGSNGISVGNELKKTYPKIIIFIVTSYEQQYLDDAMAVPVFRYLSKPLDKKRLFRNLDDAMRAYCDLVSLVTINDGTTVVTVSESDIIFIEAQNGVTLVHTVSGVYPTKTSVQAWRKTLNSSAFFPTHRGCLVNMRHIKSYQKDLIAFRSCEERAYLSRRNYKKFQQSYFFYINHIS